MYKQTSKIQSLAGEAIRFWFPIEDVLENNRPYWLFGMELDFYIPKIMLAVEVQGGQHNHYVQKYHKNSADFKRQVARDERKKELCKLQRVNLIEIVSLLELTQKIRKAVRTRSFANLPAGLTYKMREYHEAQKFISENEWVTQDINKKKKRRKA